MENLVHLIDELRDFTLGDRLHIADEHRYRLVACVDELLLPPPPIGSAVAPSSYLQLCWSLRGKISEKELLNISEGTVLRLAGKLLSSPQEAESAFDHWKERKRLELEKEAERQRQQQQEHEAEKTRLSAQRKSSPRAWVHFANPLPWRRR